MNRRYYMGSLIGTVVVLLILIGIPQLSAYSDYERDELLKAGVEDIVSTCMDGKYHKTLPGREDSLHAQCAPWAQRSCCTVETSLSVHYSKLYNFDWNHCSHVSSLSDRCKHRFRQDHCFYECSPNVGPWLVKVEQKFRNQRFVDVPICRSDCEAWYNDCIDDFTCTDNWGLNFDWKTGNNRCPVGSTCKTFGAVYGNATYFCETVWDHSWKVVDDTEHCMRLWFDPEQGNPNDAVAKWKATEIITHQMNKLKAAEANSADKISHRAAVLIMVPLFILIN